MRFFALLLAAFLNLALAAQSENISSAASTDAAKKAKFELLKLSEYKGQNVGGWLASEKLDGVRAYWDGENLLSRQGKKLNAPSSFTKNFPKFALDGELYAKELKFEEIQATVMDKLPDEKAWHRLKFHIFDEC